MAEAAKVSKSQSSLARRSTKLGSALTALVVGCSAAGPSPAPAPAPSAALSVSSKLELRDPREKHFVELTQLSFGGENAEAYWSFRGDQLIFQSTRPPYGCDQIFRMRADGAGEPVRISTGKGRTTCSYFFPGDDRILYSSTHLVSESCPPPPDRSQGYVWALYDYDVFTARADGSDLVRLTATPGYDAESTVCARDGSIVFTSIRDGDLELYRMDRNGQNVRRLTNAPGYDGGAFFSLDCTEIVWRASRPRPGKELDDYRALLAQKLVRPTQLELYVANADGSNARQITYLGVASFAPSFFPNGKRILFASNTPDPRGREFDIWAVNVDGTELERITYAPSFDGFPLFSPDGTRLAFSSNRHQKAPGETDVYVARFTGDKPFGILESGADRVQRDIAWLADDAREGRGLGTAGLAAAERYLEQRFSEIGLLPGNGSSFAQPFDVTVRIAPGDKTALSIDGKPVSRDAFAPTGFSNTTSAAGAVVPAGFGISAPELKIDEYKGVRAKDAIVVVKRFAPEGSPFDKGDAERRYGDLRLKAFTAREHGARALIVVDVPKPARGQAAPSEAPLPKLEVDPAGDAGIPVVVVTRAVGEPLLTGAHRLELTVELVREKAPAHNVVGKLAAGAGKLAGTLVIGAHYDHLGRGGSSSMTPGSNEIHNGADDNASGTAALVEVGRLLAARRNELRRDVLFVAFSGEEAGVLGSAAFVRSPPPGISAKEFVAMLNMDMVGRMRDDRLTVFGTESATEWPALVSPICEARGVVCAIGGEGFGPSDHSSFYAAGIPVLHFFTGAHREYHTPRDDAALINAAGTAQVAVIVADIALATSARPERLSYKNAPVPAPLRGDARSSGASLGTIPDYTETATPGLKLSGVRPGGPADKAGLRAGDRIVKIGNTEIRGIYDLEFLLRRAKPGEHAKVVFERDGKRHEVDVTFGERTRR